MSEYSLTPQQALEDIYRDIDSLMITLDPDDRNSYLHRLHDMRGKLTNVYNTLFPQEEPTPSPKPPRKLKRNLINGL